MVPNSACRAWWDVFVVAPLLTPDETLDRIAENFGAATKAVLG
jgi:hypothetical protein